MHPDTKVSSVTTETTARAKAVEDSFATLQNSHRLAVHVVEYKSYCFRHDKETWQNLGEVPANKINQSLRSNQPERTLFSMSLLPGRQSGCAMRLYGIDDQVLCNYGYAFDLSQNQEYPAKVLRASPSTIVSGENRKEKKLKLDTVILSLDGCLKHYYDQFSPKILPRTEWDHHRKKWEEQLYKVMGSDDGSRHTEAQLDILGQSYRNGGTKRKSNIVEFNEILVAASNEHAQGIVISQSQNNYPTTFQKPLLKLQAALVGLDHLQAGIDLPVMLYHLTPETGKLEFVGQTPEELKRVALNALLSLGKEGMEEFNGNVDRPLMFGLQDAVKAKLDINLNVHREDSELWLSQTKKQLASLNPISPVPAPPRR